MEVPQWEPLDRIWKWTLSCLNPYSNGSTTMGLPKVLSLQILSLVLILILMEVPQWVKAQIKGNK